MKTDDIAERSFEPLTIEDLTRLTVVSERDHRKFTRPDGRPEYANRRVGIALAQGAAQHYVECLEGAGHKHGVKDLDVWTFYAAIPGTTFPAYRRTTSDDFGRSHLGRQAYDLRQARTEKERSDWRKFQGYAGRRVDLLMRDLPVTPEASAVVVVEALRTWLRTGLRERGSKPSAAWHLAQRPVVMIAPVEMLGRVIWPST